LQIGCIGDTKVTSVKIGERIRRASHLLRHLQSRTVASEVWSSQVSGLTYRPIRRVRLTLSNKSLVAEGTHLKMQMKRPIVVSPLVDLV